MGIFVIYAIFTAYACFFFFVTTMITTTATTTTAATTTAIIIPVLSCSSAGEDVSVLPAALLSVTGLLLSGLLTGLVLKLTLPPLSKLRKYLGL